MSLALDPTIQRINFDFVHARTKIKQKKAPAGQSVGKVYANQKKNK